MVRILIADDHTLVRCGLRRILEERPDFSVIAETGSGLEAIELARAHCPDVAIVDIAMKELNGIETIEELLRVSRRTAVLVLSMYSDERYVMRAVKAGARGYLLKDSVEDDLIRAILSVQRGTAFFSPAIARLFQPGENRLSRATEVEDRYDTLTERERQVYHLIAEGNSNKEIAHRLNLSLHTVETHRSRIMEKLDVHSAAELVLSAVRRGLLG
jgi:two-component system, NarL family, response regulator NreC